MAGGAADKAETRTRDIANLTGQILIVDDDARVLASAKAMVQSFGLDVAVTASGPEALAWLERHRCDVVFLDWVLGEPMSGRDVLNTLKARYPDFIVAVSTGFADVPIPAGVPSLPKPYTRQQLGEVLADLLSQSGTD